MDTSCFLLIGLKVLTSVEITCGNPPVFVGKTFFHVFRLVHIDGSLADLTMLSTSSAEAALPREDEEQAKEEQPDEWGAEKENEQALVVVMDDTDKTAEKRKSFSDLQQSSTDESHHCSAGTEPEPSTEQSSGTEPQVVPAEANIQCDNLITYPTPLQVTLHNNTYDH